MKEFGKRETAVMKGAAVLQLLTHHLFYREESLENCMFLLSNGKEWLLSFAKMSKVCVVYSIVLEKVKACVHTVLFGRYAKDGAVQKAP